MTTETNAERLAEIKHWYFGGKEVGQPDILNYSEIEWLIQQAEKVRKLERQNMRYQRALKHITVFPTYFSHEYHSKRALKIARKVLKGTSS